MTSAAASPRPGALRVAAFVAAGLLLAYAGWRVLTLGIAAHQSAVAPESALRWRTAFPLAVLNFETGRTRADASGDDEARIRGAIGRAPLHPQGYKLLALRAQAHDEPARAAVLYGLAVARGPRDLQSLVWVAQHELAKGDYASALARFDQLLRVQPEVSHHFNSVLFAIASHGPAQGDFVRLLQRNPPWREEFMQRLLTRAPAVASIFPMVEKLRTEKPGLSQQELGWWVARLAADGQWGPAYLIWVQSLTPEGSQHIGNVYNGGFELEPTQTGFDWQFKSAPGSTVSRAPTSGAGENFALRLEFEDRRVQMPRVQQLVALAPGDYRLKGRVRLDDLRSERGLVWTLECVGGGGRLAETEAFSGRHEWRSFEVPFTVPADKCGGQLLSLRLPARIPAETRIGGVAWFDDLGIKAQ